MITGIYGAWARGKLTKNEVAVRGGTSKPGLALTGVADYAISITLLVIGILSLLGVLKLPKAAAGTLIGLGGAGIVATTVLLPVNQAASRPNKYPSDYSFEMEGF